MLPKFMPVGQTHHLRRLTVQFPAALLSRPPSTLASLFIQMTFTTKMRYAFFLPSTADSGVYSMASGILGSRKGDCFRLCHPASSEAYVNLRHEV